MIPPALAVLAEPLLSILGGRASIVAPIPVHGRVAGAVSVTGRHLNSLDVPVIAATARLLGAIFQRADADTTRSTQLRRLAAEAEHLDGILMAHPDAIFVCAGGSIAWANTAASSLFGVPVEDLLGAPCPHRPPGGRADVLCGVSDEWRLTRADGSIAIVQSEQAEFTLRGEARALVVLRDVGQELLAREELQRRLEIQRTTETIVALAVQGLAFPVLAAETVSALRELSWVHSTLGGAIYSVEDEPSVLIRAMAPSHCGHGGPSACDRLAFGECLCGRAAANSRVEHTAVCTECKDPHAPPHGHYAAPLMNADGVQGLLMVYLEPGCPLVEENVRFLETVASALTLAFLRERATVERSLIRSELLQAQKMEAIGTLAAGVAHDFNNLLTTITGFGTFVRQELPVGSDAYEDMSAVLHAADRAAQLTRQLLVFSRKRPPKPFIPVNLNETVRHLSRMIERVIGEDVAIELKLAAELPSVAADEGALEQVLMNLVVNARDAMPDGGAIHLGTTVRTAAPRSDPSRAPRPCVRLRVRDSGVGMSDDVLRRIFEPFYTTKAVGRGTGLGLSVAYGILESHGGWLDVASQPGRGTTFDAYIPLPEASAQAVHGASRAANDGSRTGVVLVVEDEREVRKLAARMLRRAGHEVHTAASLEEARALVAALERVDVLFTDLVLPDGNGGDLARGLLNDGAVGAAVLATGYSDDRGRSREEEGPPLPLVEKPYTLERLLSTIAAAFDTLPGAESRRL